MPQDHREPDDGSDKSFQRSTPKSGDAMQDYTQQYVTNSAMRNAVDTHRRQQTGKNEDASEEGNPLGTENYRIVKSFLGTRDKP